MLEVNLRSGRKIPGKVRASSCYVVLGIFPEDTTFQMKILNLDLEIKAISKGIFHKDIFLLDCR